MNELVHKTQIYITVTTIVSTGELASYLYDIVYLKTAYNKITWIRENEKKILKGKQVNSLVLST